MPDQPHRVDVEVGHDHRLAGLQPVAVPEPGHDLGGEEVRADDPVGPVGGEQRDERPRVQLLEGEPEALMLPGPVEVVIEPPEQLGGVVHEVEVRLAVDPAEERARVLEDVDVPDLTHGARLLEGLLEGLGRPDVPGAGGGREDQHPIQAPSAGVASPSSLMVE